MDAIAIAQSGVPVLCLDTCSLLDLMRDPTRDTALPAERQAGHELIAIAEAGGLTCLVADQVHTEFLSHDQEVQGEAERNLKRVRTQIDRIHKLALVYGAAGTIDLRHLDDHVTRARALVGRWLAKATAVTPSDNAPAKAFARVNAVRAPAVRGKDSSKDCLVFETYLEAVASIRNAGGAGKVVFLSSNVRDYLTEAKIVKPAVAADLAPLAVTFTASMQHAKHALGL